MVAPSTAGKDSFQPLLTSDVELEVIQPENKSNNCKSQSDMIVKNEIFMLKVANSCCIMRASRL